MDAADPPTEHADPAALSATAAAWAAADLLQIQRTLDSAVSDALAAQADASAARNALAQQTKDFRRTPDADKAAAVRPLVKAYQSEIDAAARRTRAADAAAARAYAALKDLPDPAPLLSAAANALSAARAAANASAAADADAVALRSQLASANEQLAAAAGLRQRLTRYEAMLNDMVDERVANKENELRAAMDEKIQVYKETEISLSRQVNLLRNQLASIQSSQLSSSDAGAASPANDARIAAKLAEFEIVLMDLDQANSRISLLERENASLKSQLSEAHSALAETGPDPSDLAARVQILESQNTTLSQQLERTAAANKSKDQTYAKQISDLERELNKKSVEANQLKTTLAEYSDYHEIKKELDIIKSIEFDGFVDQEETADPSDTKSISQPLEHLLISKNKRLQSDVTTLKSQLADTLTLLNESNHARDEAFAQNEQNQTLIAKLESDLLRLNESWAVSQSNSHRKASMSEELESLMADSRARTVPVLPRVSTTADAANSSLQQQQASTSPTQYGNEMHPSQSKTSADASIIPILTSQRDRYRQRLEEAERQLREQSQTIADLRYEISNLKSDNVKLYEKLRYTENFYTGRGAGSIGVSVDPNGNNHSVRSSATNRIASNSTSDADSDRVSNKYRNLYEDSLDPFRRFHQQEEQRRFRSMNAAERATLGLTRLLTRNKYSRLIFVIYSAALHILVFAMLYELAICSDSSGHLRPDAWSAYGAAGSGHAANAQSSIHNRSH